MTHRNRNTKTKTNTKMKNTDYIKETYKSSTIARLADYGYDTEESINLDPDMTMVLEQLKKEGNTNQQDLLDCINELQQEFYTMMDGLYPNGFITK